MKGQKVNEMGEVDRMDEVDGVHEGGVWCESCGTRLRGEYCPTCNPELEEQGEAEGIAGTAKVEEVSPRRHGEHGEERGAE